MAILLLLFSKLKHFTFIGVVIRYDFWRETIKKHVDVTFITHILFEFFFLVYLCSIRNFGKFREINYNNLKISLNCFLGV